MCAQLLLNKARVLCYNHPNFKQRQDVMIASPKELTYFLEVCRTLNLSRASERIGISQPSLSNSIKRLETAIGTDLLIRSKSGVKLTKAGLQLKKHTKQLLSLWESVKSESLASHEIVQGQFTLGCHPSVARYSLPRFLPQLLNDYKQLEINLLHDLSRKILEGVINLQIDLGIVVNPIKHPDLILQKLYDDEVSLWCSQAHAKLELTDNGYDLVCDPELIQTQHILKELEKMAKTPRRVIASSNLDVIASLTAAGLGYGILPRTVASTHSSLKQIKNMPYYSDHMYLAYRPEFRTIKAMQAIVKQIKSAFD
jgi:DNA-binding transcriptional LysR family regulator